MPGRVTATCLQLVSQGQGKCLWWDRAKGWGSGHELAVDLRPLPRSATLTKGTLARWTDIVKVTNSTIRIRILSSLVPESRLLTTGPDRLKLRPRPLAWPQRSVIRGAWQLQEPHHCGQQGFWPRVGSHGRVGSGAGSGQEWGEVGTGPGEDFGNQWDQVAQAPDVGPAVTCSERKKQTQQLTPRAVTSKLSQEISVVVVC